MARRGMSCSTTPAHSIRNTNGAALPSMIGISGPLISTIALSTAQPDSAAIRCSMVPTLTPSALPIVVLRWVSTTLSQRARISAPLAAASVRRNTMPVSGAAGHKVMVTLMPECNPVPVQLIAFLSVCWSALLEPYAPSVIAK